MTFSLQSFSLGFIAFSLDALLLVIAMRLLLRGRDEVVEASTKLRSFSMLLLGLGKTFLLIGVSYWAICSLGLSAPEFVAGAVCSGMVLMAFVIPRPHRP